MSRLSGDLRDDRGEILGNLGRDQLGVVADLEECGLDRSQSRDDFFQAQPGLVLHEPRDREGGEHDGEVRFDCVTLPVEHGLGLQICLVHPERLLDVPEVVIARDRLPRPITSAGMSVTQPFSPTRRRARSPGRDGTGSSPQRRF